MASISYTLTFWTLNKCWEKSRVISVSSKPYRSSERITIRRKLSPYRRRTNTYAKTKASLQRVLDVYWCIHNFVREHFTLKVVPAVELGIIKEPMSWKNIMSVKMANWLFVNKVWQLNQTAAVPISGKSSKVSRDRLCQVFCRLLKILMLASCRLLYPKSNEVIWQSHC